jgi:hypothetical protein
MILISTVTQVSQVISNEVVPNDDQLITDFPLQSRLHKHFSVHRDLETLSDPEPNLRIVVSTTVEESLNISSLGAPGARVCEDLEPSVLVYNRHI